MQQAKLSFRRGDWLAVALVATVALGVFAAFLPVDSGVTDAVVQLYMDGAPVRELPLHTDTEFILEGRYSNTLTIQNGRAAITKSDCPGEDCVYSGWISDLGRSIVCLPNRVEIRITGASDVDFALR